MAMPTGGTITTDGLYTVHTFTSSGNFVVDYWKPGATAWVLVVGGGGNSPSETGRSGGGGGGVKQNQNYILSKGTIAVTVGGAASSSIFGNITATGGGQGTGYNTFVGGTSGADSSHPGGTGAKFGDYQECGGGGGGSNQNGGNGTSSNGGKGGDGVLCTIYDGTNRYYGGGGGGAVAKNIANYGVGGLGGGGNGAKQGSYAGTDGAPNTGGGAGGNNHTGGSGIVIIRYLTANAKPAGANFIPFFL